MIAKLDIYQESWRITNDLERSGSAIGPSICRDSVNHYYCLHHPNACVITDAVYSLDARYSIKQVVIVNGCWSLR